MLGVCAPLRPAPPDGRRPVAAHCTMRRVDERLLVHRQASLEIASNGTPMRAGRGCGRSLAGHRERDALIHEAAPAMTVSRARCRVSPSATAAAMPPAPTARRTFADGRRGDDRDRPGRKLQAQKARKPAADDDDIRDGATWIGPGQMPLIRSLRSPPSPAKAGRRNQRLALQVIIPRRAPRLAAIIDRL